MGGFVDGTNCSHSTDIERLVRTDEIEYPIVTREEIQDKSKGDAVTKALVVLQTTWFLLQCAARAKPTSGIDRTRTRDGCVRIAQHHHLRTLVGQTVGRAMPYRGTQEERTRRCQRSQSWSRIQGQGRHWKRVESPPDMSGIAWTRCLEWLRSARDGLWGVFCGWEWKDVWEGLWSVINSFFDMMDGSNDQEMFFVVGGQGGWDVSSVSGMILVTMVFGGIHCVAWSFAFPSSTEQLLWRISSIAITGIPLAVVGV